MRQGLPARLAIASSAALLVAAVAAAFAAEGDPLPGTEFTDTSGGDYYVNSTGSDEWAIRGMRANPKVAEWLVEPNSQSTDPRERQGVAALWAPTCSKKRQTVHIRRSFFIAGPEYSLGALIQPTSRGRASMESVDLRVNGISVLKSKGATEGFDATDKNLKRLRFGRNNIDVIAVKRANPKGVKCNASKRNAFGVGFWIYGEFGGDTGLLEPPAGDQVVRTEPGASRVLIEPSWQVRNVGPGGAAGMGLNIQLGIPRHNDFLLLEPKYIDPRVKGCTIDSYSGDKFQPIISCRLINVPAGEKVTVPVRIGFYLPEQRPWRSQTMYMSWSVRHGGEERPGGPETDRDAEMIFCEHDYTEGPCG